MLIDMVKMPPTFGIPINRFHTVSIGDNSPPFGPNSIKWSGPSRIRNHFTCGSVIEKRPSNLYKSFHIGSQGRHIFETVFSVENNRHICLYTKIIRSHESHFGVSLDAVRFYCDHYNLAVPVSSLIVPDSFNQNNHFSKIVPIILDEHTLWSYANALDNENSDVLRTAQTDLFYKPLYDYAPNIYEALIGGYFVRSPFNELMSNYPFVSIRKPSSYEYCDIQAICNRHGFTCEINNKSFDLPVLRVMELQVSNMSVTSLMSHALDALSAVWLVREYDDPYHAILHGHYDNEDQRKALLVNIFYVAAQIYCRMFSIDPDNFMRTGLLSSPDESSITITKNIYDEVTITIHDLINDRYICYYYSFPALALATMGVGGV